MTDSPPRLLTPGFVALTASDLAYFTAAGVLIALTPVFAAGPLGAGAAGVGLAMGAFSVTTLALRPLAGRWTDRHGRRRLLVGGAAAFAVVAVGHLLVTGMAGLVLVRLLLGAAEACYFVAGFAALADLAPPARAGEALSLNSLALYAGLALGPVLGQLLHRTGGFDLVWIGAVGLAGVAALLARRVPETRGTVAPGGPTPLLHRSALVPGAALFCGVLVMAGFLAFGVLRAQQVGLEAWSLVLLLFGACVVGCRIGFARLPDRRPTRVVLLGALGTIALGAVALGVAPGVPGLLAGAVLCGVGTAFLTPAAFAMVFAAVPPEERGSAAATTSLFLDLGFTGGPVLLGLVAAASTLPAGFVVLASVPLAAMAVVAARTGGRLRS